MVFRETFETAGTLLGEVSMPELQDKPALDAEEIRSPGAIDDNDEDNEDEEDDDVEDGEDEDEDDEEEIKEPEDGV
jgi:hypothetical protein